MQAYRRLCSSSCSAEELSDDQTQRLAVFLLQIKAGNPLYAELLGNVSIEEIQSHPQGVLQALPPIDKAFINENRARLFSPVPGRKWQHKKTGGSTGEPFRYAIDLESVSESWAYILWCWNKYAGYRPGDFYITVAGSSLGAAGHRLKTRAYQALQNNYLISGDVISRGMQVDQRRIKQARLIFCYPSSMLALLESQPDVFSNHQLKAVFTTSEQLLPQVRQFIEQQLQVPVFDMYGANDGGVISCECEEHEGYHYDPFNCYVESVQQGVGQNELLLTSLTSVGFPFVRYRVGDVADLGDFGSCRCGNPFPMIYNLSGRTRDILKLQDGRRIHGVVFNRLFYRFPEVRRYRIVQASDYQVTVMLDIENFDRWHVSSEKCRMEDALIEILGETTFIMQPLVRLSDGRGKLKLIESHVS